MNLNDFHINAYKNAGRFDLHAKNEKENKLLPEEKKQSILNKDSSSMTKALVSGGLLKVPAMPKEKDGRDNVYRRVAKFLLLIGVDEASKILPHLTEEQTEKIIPEIASIQRVDPDEAEAILEEFQSLLHKAREDGGVDTARTILEKAFGTEQANKMLDKIVPFQAGKPFEYLQEADSDKISQLLKDESSAVKALVLSYLRPKISAEVIQKMTPADKKDVIIRLSRLKDISPDVLKRVDAAMNEKLKHVSIQKADTIDGRSALAQILKRMSPESEEELLDTLSNQDPDLGADLRERLFTSEDVISADDKFVQNYLRSMSDDDIALLLANKSDEFRRKILKNVSTNRGNSILETEQINKPMRRADVERVTSHFFADLRRAFEEGKLFIDGRDGEMYV